MRKDAKAELIRRAPLFAHCSEQEVAEIAAAADEMFFREGTELTRQGASGHELVVLVEGTVDVERDGSIVNSLGAGDFFGEVALVKDEPRNATVRATSPVRALVLVDRDFKRLLDKSPELERKVMLALAERS